MNTAYLLLGSNLEDRNAMLCRAALEINSRIGKITQSSSLYESEPWGFQSEHNFLNQVIKVETELLPAAMLDAILEIENHMGRKRAGDSGEYTSRTIDIDILFYNDEIIRENQLAIPHPRIPERMFTLVPMCELNASLIHPVLRVTLRDLMEMCPDRNMVMLYKS